MELKQRKGPKRRILKIVDTDRKELAQQAVNNREHSVENRINRSLERSQKMRKQAVSALSHEEDIDDVVIQENRSETTLNNEDGAILSVQSDYLPLVSKAPEVSIKKTKGKSRMM